MNLGERLRKYGEGTIHEILLSRADARYLADLVRRDSHIPEERSGTEVPEQ